MTDDLVLDHDLDRCPLLEAVEAAAAVEIAALCGDARLKAVREVARLADRLVALLTALVR